MSSTEMRSHVWIPSPDSAPFHIRGPADALTLAAAWAWLPAFGLLLAFLDADQRITFMVTDPEPDVIFHPDQVERPGLTRPVRSVALFSVASASEYLSMSTTSLFAILQRTYRDHGIRLVDWVQIDFEEDLYRSMQINARERRGTAADYLRVGVCV